MLWFRTQVVAGFLLGFYLLSAASSARAAERMWNAASGNFGQATNWAPGFVPGAADQATFANGGGYTVTFNSFGALPNPTLNRDLVLSAGNVTFTSNAGSPYSYRLTGGGGSDASISGGTLTLGTGSDNPLHLTVDDDLVVQAGGTLNVLAGSVVNAADLVLANSGGNGTVVVDGSSSRLHVNGAGTQSLALAGNTGTLTYRNSAQGSFSGPLHVGVDGTAGTSGVLNVLSGAQLSVGNLAIGTGSNGSGAVNLGGGGSAIVQAGASTLNIGAAAGSAAALTIGTTTGGSTLTMGTGLLTINKTGALTVGVGTNSGTLNAGGDVTVDGGVLHLNTAGTFQLPEGKTLAVQNGGEFSGAADYTCAPNAVYNISGTNSKLSFPGFVGIVQGAQVNVSSGAQFSVGLLLISNASEMEGESTLNVGVASSGTLLTADSIFVTTKGRVTLGGPGATGTAILTNGLFVNRGVFQSECDLTLPSIEVLNGEATIRLPTGNLTISGELTVRGSSSKLNLLGGTGLTVGPGATALVENSGTVTSSGDLHVQAGGEFILGGTATVRSIVNEGEILFGGALQITGPAGLTLNANSVGDNFVVDEFRPLTVVNTTTIPVGRSLSIQGGVFTTGSLIIQGAFNFEKGALGITGPAGLTIGAGSILGSTLLIDNNRALNVTNTLTISSGSTLTAHFATGLSAGQLVNNGDLVLIHSSVSGSVVNNHAVTVVGDVDFNGPVSGAGEFFGPGTAHFNGGFSPGASPAVVHFEGNVSLGSANVLTIEIGGTTAGVNYDQLHVDGELSLAGRLEVLQINSPFTPTLGQQFEILNADVIHGAFSSTKFPLLAAPLGWDTSELYTSGVLTVTDTVHGDWNRDGEFTAADIRAMLVGLTNLSAYAATNSLDPTKLAAIGDFDQSGTVTNADLQGLLNALATSGGGSIAAVPEPAAWLLGVIGWVGVVCARRGRN